MDRHSAFGREKLAVLWAQGTKPVLEAADIRQTYQHIYVPALTGDLTRMLAAWAGSKVKKQPVSFDRCQKGIVQTRMNLAELALPDLAPFENAFADIHARYMAREIYGITSHGETLLRGLSLNALPENDPGYLAARHQCVAADTSEALSDFGEFLYADQGRAMLYDARVGDPENGERDFIKSWIENRKRHDLKKLEEEISWSIVAPELQRRHVRAEVEHHTIPARGDLDVEMRQQTMRRRNRPLRHRAA